jgi:predicted nucleic acid-binding protein
LKILDTSSIICTLTEINEPEILLKWKARGHELTIPNMVYKELCANKNTLSKVKPYIEERKINITTTIKEEEVKKFKLRHLNLGNGEISVILTSIQLNKAGEKYYAVIDDKQARKIANLYNVNLTGTIGLLMGLKSKGLIDTKYYDKVREKFRNSQFHINVTELEEEYGSRSEIKRS